MSIGFNPGGNTSTGPNTLETRILICNDTEINWGGSSKVLLKGEIGISFPTDTTKEPVLKVGNGVDLFNNLKELNVRPSELKELTDKIGSLATLKTTNKTDIITAINELVDSVKSSGLVTIDTQTTTSGYAKSYTIKQGIGSDGNDKVIGVIDIPKDLFAVSGTVEEYTDTTLPVGANAPTIAGTYIKIIIQNQDDPIYINANTLVDNYTVKANAAQVQLAIDTATREISAQIVNGSVDENALANNAVTTDKIKDGNVTKAKLEQSVQDTLNKADVAVSDVKLNGSTLAKDSSNAVNIMAIPTDILENGNRTLILDGGDSTFTITT